MVAIIFVSETKYDCNDYHDEDIIKMQSLLRIGPYMIAIIQNFFSRDSFKNDSHLTLGRIATLQSYMVRFGVVIAFILGPHRDNHCNHS